MAVLLDVFGEGRVFDVTGDVFTLVRDVSAKSLTLWLEEDVEVVASLEGDALVETPTDSLDTRLEVISLLDGFRDFDTLGFETVLCLDPARDISTSLDGSGDNGREYGSSTGVESARIVRSNSRSRQLSSKLSADASDDPSAISCRTLSRTHDVIWLAISRTVSDSERAGSTFDTVLATFSTEETTCRAVRLMTDVSEHDFVADMADMPSARWPVSSFVTLSVT